MVKIEVFDTFLRKSIVMVDFEPYFLVRFPCRNMVKIEVFHTFSEEKYRDSRKQDDFGPLFLARFPYNYLGKNERFKLHVIREIVKCGFWSKTGSFGALLLCALPFMQD